MNAAPRFFPLLRAELRQFWWLQLSVFGSGIGMLVLLGAVTSRVSTNAQPEGVAFNYMASLMVSIAPVLLVSSGLANGGMAWRNEFLGALPLPRISMNLVRLSSFVILMWPAMLTWPLIIALLFSVYGPTSPWTLVNTSLLAALGLLLSLRTRFGAIVVYLALPAQALLLYFIPGLEELGRWWFQLNSSHLTALGFSILMLMLGRWLLHAPTQR